MDGNEQKWLYYYWNAVDEEKMCLLYNFHKWFDLYPCQVIAMYILVAFHSDASMVYFEWTRFVEKEGENRDGQQSIRYHPVMIY